MRGTFLFFITAFFLPLYTGNCTPPAGCPDRSQFSCGAFNRSEIIVAGKLAYVDRAADSLLFMTDRYYKGSGPKELSVNNPNPDKKVCTLDRFSKYTSYLIYVQQDCSDKKCPGGGGSKWVKISDISNDTHEAELVEKAVLAGRCDVCDGGWMGLLNLPNGLFALDEENSLHPCSKDSAAGKQASSK